MKLSVIIPCYNEENNIDKFYEKFLNEFKNFKGNYELIFINDGSKDNTLLKLKNIVQKSNKTIKIINFSRNFGKEAGIYAGLKEAKGNYVAIIDADLQQNPKLILKMFNILKDKPEYDSVACYQEKRNDPFLKKIFSILFYKIINKISEIKFIEGASDFRLLKRNVVNSVLELSEYYRFSKGIFSYVGYNTYYMPYKAEKRYAGKSKWSFFKLLKYAIDGIVSFTTAPLKIATILGIITFTFSFFYLFILLIQTIIFGIDVPGYATTIGTILLLGGIQLLTLGIIGEYLGRTYMEVKRRPLYIIKEKITNEKSL